MAKENLGIDFEIYPNEMTKDFFRDVIPVGTEISYTLWQNSNQIPLVVIKTESGFSALNANSKQPVSMHADRTGYVTFKEGTDNQNISSYELTTDGFRTRTTMDYGTEPVKIHIENFNGNLRSTIDFLNGLPKNMVIKGVNSDGEAVELIKTGNGYKAVIKSPYQTVFELSTRSSQESESEYFHRAHDNLSTAANFVRELCTTPKDYKIALTNSPVAQVETVAIFAEDTTSQVQRRNALYAQIANHIGKTWLQAKLEAKADGFSDIGQTKCWQDLKTKYKQAFGNGAVFDLKNFHDQLAKTTLLKKPEMADELIAKALKPLSPFFTIERSKELATALGLPPLTDTKINAANWNTDNSKFPLGRLPSDYTVPSAIPVSNNHKTVPVQTFHG